MHSDETFNFLEWALPATQSVLTAALWIMIFMRVKSIVASNRQFPSRWRTVSVVLIVVSGVLATLYISCMIASSVLGGITWNIASKKNIPSDSLTVDDFTPAEVGKIVESVKQALGFLIAARFFLNFSLWTSKLAFLCFFIGNREYVTKRKRLALYVTAGLTLLFFVAAVIVMFYGFRPSPLPPVPIEEFTLGAYWKGASFVWFFPWIEYTLASLGAAQEIYVTVMACYIIRSMPGSSNGIFLLLFVLGINIVSSCFILVGFTLIQGPGALPGVYLSTVRILIPTVVFMMDFNVILSIILSCLPGAKAWVLGIRRKRNTSPGGARLDVKHPATKAQEACQLQLFDVERDTDTSH